MGTLTADHDELRDAVAGLRDAAGRLAACRDRAAGSVDGLLGTWHGAAAAAYAEGWAEWRAGAGQVLDRLRVMAVLIDAASADLAATDAASRGSLVRLTGRLG